jgi:biopolymer transport protein ExbB
MQEFQRFATEHWYFAWPLFGMSLVAVTLVVWRIMLNVQANTNLNTFLPAFQEKLNREGVDGAARFCRTAPGLIAKRLYVAGLETQKQGLSAMRRAMANTVELEVLPELNFLLPMILAIAKIATMVGLLGTVISMIFTFTEIEQLKATGGDVTSKSGSIGLALFATALGLVTAIPLVFAHVLFKAWVNNFEIKMKNAAQKLMVIMQAQRAAPAAKAKAAGSQSGASQRPAVSET